MQLTAYVEQSFGGDTATKLNNIRRGGDNNRKGDSFETYYAAAKVCEIAANQVQMDDFLMSSQELAFVDDLCVRQVSTARKENFQAKNSAGDAASWDAEMAERFRMQIQIDSDFYKCPDNRQVLLVSCPDKAAANDTKIPGELKAHCFSEFFPYHPKSTHLLYKSAELRANLQKICESDDLHIIDTAFRHVVFAWTCNDAQRSVGDIIGQAKALSRPNIFGSTIPERGDIPDWLHRICMAFPDLVSRVEFGNFIVSYNGFEVGLGSSPAEPEPGIVEKMGSIGEAFAFLMTRAQKDL
ncbi:hypothetical protein KUC54_14665 [Pseudomonas aeruginosa]|uniref:hypothetical protein n=1 Tax=Pseudomonas aeruginosa TaxID=287 RepID=UPI0021E20B7D|nr:hypothetical protein [Pseudomonas aeruginosa]MCV0149622.1 hypothetical protein [Pseudomonas aeruginosa]